MPNGPLPLDLERLQLNPHDIERRKGCGREQLHGDALKTGDVTAEMGVVDINGHAKRVPFGGIGAGRYRTWASTWVWLTSLALFRSRGSRTAIMTTN